MVYLSRILRTGSNFSKWYFGLQGYNKFGLYDNDFYDYTDATHLEAIRRLPPEVYDEHTFRVIRAAQLEITKQFLPQSQWPTFEEDKSEKGQFLKPYLDEVLQEKKEKDEWYDFLSKD